MKRHKLFLCILILFTLLVGKTVYGSETTVEIFYLAHRPALAVVSKIDKILAQFPKITIKIYDFEARSTRELLQQYKLKGHMPVAVFINGKNKFTVNGKTISLRNFPKGDAFVPTFAGEWDYVDLQKILTSINGGK